MKLWLDDNRPPPDDTWMWAKTAEIAISSLELVKIEEVSLDHDLGTTADGNDVLQWLVEKCYFDDKFVAPKVIGIHTMNVVERFKMMESARRIRGVDFVTAETPEGKRL